MSDKSLWLIYDKENKPALACAIHMTGYADRSELWPYYCISLANGQLSSLWSNQSLIQYDNSFVTYKTITIKPAVNWHTDQPLSCYLTSYSALSKFIPDYTPYYSSASAQPIVWVQQHNTVKPDDFTGQYIQYAVAPSTWNRRMQHTVFYGPLSVTLNQQITEPETLLWAYKSHGGLVYVVGADGQSFADPVTNMEAVQPVLRFSDDELGYITKIQPTQDTRVFQDVQLRLSAFQSPDDQVALYTATLTIQLTDTGYKASGVIRAQQQVYQVFEQWTDFTGRWHMQVQDLARELITSARQHDTLRDALGDYKGSVFGDGSLTIYAADAQGSNSIYVILGTATALDKVDGTISTRVCTRIRQAVLDVDGTSYYTKCQFV